MTMRNDIKDMIEAIMDSQVSEIEDAVNSACDKVDEIFNKIEDTLDMAVSDLDDPDNLESVKSDLKKAYDEV